MSNLILEKTCCFSGHREIDKSFNRELISATLLKAVELGYDTFLCGMARGFDSFCFDAVTKLKKTHDLKLIACVPCLNQDRYFSQTDKRAYDLRINSSDEVLYISKKEYFNGCMQMRNRFMVDNSTLVICYLKENKGGTKSTVDYAVKKNREIINLAKAPESVYRQQIFDNQMVK